MVGWLAGCCCCSLEIGKVVCLFVQVGHKWMDNKDKMESKCQKEEKEVNGMEWIFGVKMIKKSSSFSIKQMMKNSCEFMIYNDDDILGFTKL